MTNTMFDPEYAARISAGGGMPYDPRMLQTVSRGYNPAMEELNAAVQAAADRAAEARAWEAQFNNRIGSSLDGPLARAAAARTAGRVLGKTLPVLAQLDLAATLGSGLYQRFKNFNDLRELAPTEPEPYGY